MSDFSTLDLNDDGTVGLMKYDGDVGEDYVGSEAVDPDVLIEAAERCKEMGWDEVELHVRPDREYPILMHEWQDDQGIYVAIAPLIPDQ